MNINALNDTTLYDSVRTAEQYVTDYRAMLEENGQKISQALVDDILKRLKTIENTIHPFDREIVFSGIASSCLLVSIQPPVKVATGQDPLIADIQYRLDAIKDIIDPSDCNLIRAGITASCLLTAGTAA